MADIFLSYARADRSKIEPLVGRLEKEKWSVFWDPAILPGHQWDEHLQQELEAARVVVVAWSTSSIASHWVREEAASGRERGVLVPVVIDDTKLPFGFALIQAERLADWDGRGDTPAVARLLDGIRRILADRSAAVAEVTTQRSEPVPAKKREAVPLSSQELIERLTRPIYWGEAMSGEARRFFQLLVEWRKESSTGALADLKVLYHPLDPDALTRIPGNETLELKPRVKQFMAATGEMLIRAGYERLSPEDLAGALAKPSPYGLDFIVDLNDFEDLGFYFRGIVKVPEEHRSWRTLFFARIVEVPFFQKIVLVFKPAPDRRTLPGSSSELVYLRLFKDTPRADIAVLFPNVRIRIRSWDKVRAGLVAVAGLGIGIVGMAGKIALLANPIAVAGAAVGLAGIAVREFTNIANRARAFTAVIAEHLYWKVMAANGDVLSAVGERGCEDEVVGEILLYFLLLKEPVARTEFNKVVANIERYLLLEYGVSMPLNYHASLERLIRDGLVSKGQGRLTAVRPDEGRRLIEARLSSQYSMSAAPA